jgi:hypothetical protein
MKEKGTAESPGINGGQSESEEGTYGQGKAAKSIAAAGGKA